MHVRELDAVPRSRWLSGAGGVAVAYVFVHLLPELAAGRPHLARALADDIGFPHHLPYLLALLGLSVFYGLERLAVQSRHDHRAHGGRDRSESQVFWVHVGSFALYNVLIGYLLARSESPSGRGLVLFTLAMALHFVVNDVGLRDHHKELYVRTGRWLLAAAVLAGWAVGQALTVREVVLHALTAFLAGGIVLNVLKEELPEDRESRFGSFALGAAAYTALLLAL